jgi:hypothetical protein
VGQAERPDEGADTGDLVDLNLRKAVDCGVSLSYVDGTRAPTRRQGY